MDESEDRYRVVVDGILDVNVAKALFDRLSAGANQSMGLSFRVEQYDPMRVGDPARVVIEHG